MLSIYQMTSEEGSSSKEGSTILILHNRPGADVEFE